MTGRIRSIHEAVEIFSEEVGLDLEMMEGNSIATVRAKYGDDWGPTSLPDNIYVRRLFNDGEYYGGMVFEHGWNGVMKSCLYHGRHPTRDQLGLVVVRDDFTGHNYIRSDGNGALFLGVGSKLRDERSSNRPQIYHLEPLIYNLPESVDVLA